VQLPDCTSSATAWCLAVPACCGTPGARARKDLYAAIRGEAVALREQRATRGTARGVGADGGVRMLGWAGGRRRSSTLGRERGSGRAALRLAAGAGGCLSSCRRESGLAG
jgi:hypothetical protein